jgi:hypothetical protein
MITSTGLHAAFGTMGTSLRTTVNPWLTGTLLVAVALPYTAP